MGVQDRGRIGTQGINQVGQNINATPWIWNIQQHSTNANICYAGAADPGVATSAALWRIMEINTATGTVIKWAGGLPRFNQIFDSRESLSYS